MIKGNYLNGNGNLWQESYKRAASVLLPLLHLKYFQEALSLPTQFFGLFLACGARRMKSGTAFTKTERLRSFTFCSPK